MRCASGFHKKRREASDLGRNEIGQPRMSYQQALLQLLPMVPTLVVTVFGLLAARRLSSNSPTRARLVTGGMVFWLVSLLIGLANRMFVTIGQPDPAIISNAWNAIIGISSDLFFLIGCAILLLACLTLRREFLNGDSSEQGPSTNEN